MKTGFQSFNPGDCGHHFDLDPAVFRRDWFGSLRRGDVLGQPGNHRRKRLRKRFDGPIRSDRFRWEAKSNRRMADDSRDREVRWW